MNVRTEVREEHVTVYLDGREVGQLDRSFWDEWTARIDNEPETCLAACLAGDADPALDPRPVDDRGS